MEELLKEISQCELCKRHLPFGCRPVLTASKSSKIIVVGQAPGRVVHRTGIPWNDKSGDRLREWMGVDKEAFYDTDKFALVPMGFCYPGTGKSGDLPPRPECAPAWHGRVFDLIEAPRLTIIIGQYALKYYLGNRAEKNLTETVRRFENYLPTFFALPHPSPRNNLWLWRNPWFEKDVIPILREYTTSTLR